MRGLDRQVVVFGAFRLDVDDRILLRAGQQVPLAPKEFETLLVLVENAERLVSKEDLIAQVWPDTFVGDGSLARNISVLRKALGDELIQTVPRLGYRFTASISRIPSNGYQAGDSTASVPHAELSEVAPQAPSARRVFLRKTGWGLAIALMVAVATVLLYKQLLPSRTKAHAAAGFVKIAVLPFENLTGNESEEFLCDGLTEAMISELSRLNTDQLQVIARTSSMQYKKTGKQIPQIGRELGVDYLLESSVRSSGTRIRVTAQLVRSADATHVWSGEYERDLKDVLEVQQEVAMAIAGEVDLKLVLTSDERQHHGNVVNPEAYRYYLLGRYHWNKRTREEILQSLADYHRSVQVDPNYSRAYAGMADTYVYMAWWGIAPYREAYAKSREAAQTALHLDPSFAEPYATLGIVDFMYTLDWATAEENFRRAIALDPNYSTAHHWYAQYLAAMKRPDEAIREIQKAAELDPLSLGISQNTGLILIEAGRYEHAIQQLDRSMEIDPANQVTWGYLGQAHECRHEYALALNDFRTAQKLSGEFVPYAPDIAHVLVLEGKKDQARVILQKLIAYRQRRAVSAYSFVFVYAALGDNNSAFEWLNKSIEERSITVVELNNDRRIDPLRADPRFAEIRRQLKLPS